MRLINLKTVFAAFTSALIVMFIGNGCTENTVSLQKLIISSPSKVTGKLSSKLESEFQSDKVSQELQDLVLELDQEFEAGETELSEDRLIGETVNFEDFDQYLISQTPVVKHIGQDLSHIDVDEYLASMENSNVFLGEDLSRFPPDLLGAEILDKSEPAQPMQIGDDLTNVEFPE